MSTLRGATLVAALVSPFCAPAGAFVPLTLGPPGLKSANPAPARSWACRLTAGTQAGHKGRVRMLSEGPTGMENAGQQDEGQQDPRVYTVTISRATGIDWASDLSFKWVFIRGLEPGGSASMSGQVNVGDQLVGVNGETTAGAPFDYAMQLISATEGRDLELSFFRGSKEDLQGVLEADAGPDTVTIKVVQEGKGEKVLTAAAGTNLRDVLVSNGINVYQSFTRWSNCNGKQLCGTCIVAMDEGLDACTIKSIDEQATLRSNPPNYRLSCVTNLYGDVTVRVFPPVGADQWTR